MSAPRSSVIGSCTPYSHEIRVSVVIPTLNRESALLDTVGALLEAPSPYFVELIVVDQSDNPSRLAECKDDRLIYKHVEFRNLPRARNYGTSLAKGNVVLFVDDDVACVSRLIEAHALAHIRTGAPVVTGPVFTKGETLISVSSLPPEQRGKLDTGKLFILNLNVEYSPLFAPGCNMSYRKEILAGLSGFDENFIGSAVGEDAEMSHRVKGSGGMIIYDPAASLLHLRVPMGGCRDEVDELKADEARVFNAHYYANKIGRPGLGPSSFWRILRTRVLNRKTLRTLPMSTLVLRTCWLLRTWWRARARTNKLIRAGRTLGCGKASIVKP